MNKLNIFNNIVFEAASVQLKTTSIHFTLKAVKIRKNEQQFIYA